VALATAGDRPQHVPDKAEPVAATHAMSVVHANQDAAARWLLERRDLVERRETIGIIMNAALLVFIASSICWVSSICSSGSTERSATPLLAALTGDVYAP
jgi:hypothetical protein